MLTSILLTFASSFGGFDKPAIATFNSPTNFNELSFSKFDFAKSGKFDFNSFVKADAKFGFEKGLKAGCDAKLNKACGFVVKENFTAISNADKAFSFERGDGKIDFVKGSKDAFELKTSTDGEAKATA